MLLNGSGLGEVPKARSRSDSAGTIFILGLLMILVFSRVRLGESKSSQQTVGEIGESLIRVIEYNILIEPSRLGNFTRLGVCDRRQISQHVAFETRTSEKALTRPTLQRPHATFDIGPHAKLHRNGHLLTGSATLSRCGLFSFVKTRPILYRSMLSSLVVKIRCLLMKSDQMCRERSFFIP